jgi:hypothetical protein
VQSFWHEGQVQVGEETLHLVFNFRSIDVIEGITGRKMPDIIPDMVDPSQSLAVKFLYGMLVEKRPGITLDEAAYLGLGEHDAAIGLVMADVIRRAYPRAFGEAKDKNPPKRRGASKSS